MALVLNKPVNITRLAESVYESAALLAGMQLDLFTLLAGGPLTADDLADRLDVRSYKLSILCYALVAADLLVARNGRFSNTSEAEQFLVSGKPDSLSDRHHIWSKIWPAALQAAETIRSGEPQAHLDFGSISAEDQFAFFSGLHPASVAGGREFAGAHDLSGYTKMLDVGCGSGGFTLGVTEGWPHLGATVLDLPHIVNLTRRFLEDAGAEERIGLVGADLTNDCPGDLVDEFDLVILRNFLQVFSAEQARSALSHVAAAVQPGGHLYVTGHILDDTREGPRETASFNIVFLNIYEDGQAYTQSQYTDWLTEAGFVDIRWPSVDRVIATKP